MFSRRRGLESVVGNDLCFPRRQRAVTGGDGGFGGRRRARKAARKGGAKVSFDAPERGKEKMGVQGGGGGCTASESMMSGGGTCELRRGISAAQRRLLQRGEGGAREESRGFYRVEP
jgi:hypothetical protein